MAVTDPYATGVLVPEHHDRLVADIERYALDANIRPEWIWRPLDAADCDGAIRHWVIKFRHHALARRSGLLLVGEQPNPPIEDRMAAIAGALLRNFIRARVVTLGQLLTTAHAAGPDGLGLPELTCLLVPNFHVRRATRQRAEVSWRVEILLDVLLERHAVGLQTVLYASDLASLTAEYGPAVGRHLEAHYVQIGI